ncbi:MAG: 4'-phosphopantetheinyl transferase superfamily protein [Ruminococcus sp.]|jgi:4'-phosphopantetheinyl transferase|nr:4'-phosphopantetheinyl transferase superfamily protein [Ruminococcus sp.]
MDRVYFELRSTYRFTPDELALIPESRFKKAARYSFEPDRNLCLAAGLLIARLYGRKAEDQFVYNTYGKPYGKDLKPKFFNVSHSGWIAVIVAADREIGVDIEDATRKIPDVAEKIFSDTEMSYYKHAGNKEHAFYKLWTGKESVMKASGKGLALSPSSFSITNALEGHTIFADGKEYELQWDNYRHFIMCKAMLVS